MTATQTLINQLEKIIASESTESLTLLGSYVLGAIFTESQDLYESNPIVERISDLASDLETSNGDTQELQKSWETIKTLTESLKIKSNE